VQATHIPSHTEEAVGCSFQLLVGEEKPGPTNGAIIVVYEFLSTLSTEPEP
jgi:hypothetical protein